MLGEVQRFDALGLVEEGRGFGVGGRREEWDGVDGRQVLADGAALVEREVVGGEGDGGDFAPGVAAEVFGGLGGLLAGLLAGRGVEGGEG